MKLQHSIVTRFALFFTSLIIFVILISGYLVFKKASGVITEYSKERIMHTSELAEQSFYSLLNEVSNDIAVISSSPTLQNYIFSPSEKNTIDLENLFKVTLQNKASYFQIRLIGTENNGKEIIRFDKMEQKVLKSENLQEKGDREYFKEAIKIDEGEFYFSKINLNEEYGVISKPYTPTLRAASPIFNTNNQIIGVVVINVELNQFYKNLAQISGADSQLYMVDNEGQYLYAPNKDFEFGLQLNNDHNFQKSFNVEMKSVISSKEGFNQLKDVDSNIYLNYIKELSYFQGKRKIYLISAVEENLLLKSARKVRAESTQTLLWVCLFSILMSWFFTNFLSKRIVQVTKAISNYDKGITDEIALPIERKDEIGTLARTFTKMKSKIDQNVLELNEALGKEQKAKRQRDEFLQNMSHEMRTPLNAILGLIQILNKNSPSESQIPIIQSLERSSNNLAGLVYDVLDHQKLLEGKLNISYQPADIASLLKDIHATYQYDTIQKELDFKLSIDKKLTEFNFQTDVLRLSQIITNLVVNAIKYTHKGSIELSASIVNNKPPNLVVKIIDTGIGIQPENLSKINDRFFREKEDLNGRYGGYGLGLSIVKQLTELFGGKLQATSKKNVGSEFCVTIPVLASSEKESKPNSKSNRKSISILNKQYTILHIEDDHSTRELIKHLLKDNNITLTQTSGIEDAENILNKEQPDIVISDLMLEELKLKPILENWISTNKIKCPLLIVSAMEPKIMKETFPLYFHKPFDLNHLKDTVYKILGENEFTPPDFSTLYNNYDHNSDKVAKVLHLLHEEFETYLIRIEKAIIDQDQNEWEAIVHKLIAHIKSLKLSDLSELKQKEVTELKGTDLNKIKRIIYYYLHCFRIGIQVNSED